jgi:molybdopterin-guanine dinucleotide biosynthesis protein A
MSQRIGVVLAGGSGRRMGVAKGQMLFEGATLALRAARTLWPVCGSVLVSVAPGAANPAPGFPVVEDAPPPGRGPLAGILAAFDATGTADLVILACDYPFVVPDLLVGLVAAAREEDALVMPTDPTGRDHPLVALWRRSTAPHVRDALEQGIHKVRRILPELSVRRLGPSDFPGTDLARSLSNWNRPQDVE